MSDSSIPIASTEEIAEKALSENSASRHSVHGRTHVTDVNEPDDVVAHPLPADQPAGLDSELKADPDDKPHFWLRRGDQLFVGVLVLAALVLMSCHWIRLSGWGQQAVDIEGLPSRQYDFKIDVNTATWVEFAQLKGIGETLAHRITTGRAQHGPFQSLDDLRRVKGIGPKTIEKARPWLVIDRQKQETQK